MKDSWQVWRDRRGRLSPLRLATLALLLFPLAKALFDASDIAHGARPSLLRAGENPSKFAASGSCAVEREGVVFSPDIFLKCARSALHATENYYSYGSGHRGPEL